MADHSFLDWPFLEDRHRALAAAAESWAEDSLGASDHADVDAACRALVSALGRVGFLDHTASERGSLDIRSLCILRETLARHDALADFALAMQGLGTGAVTLFGTDAQRSTWLPETRAGRAIAAFALTEPGSGSDVAGSSMTAIPDGNGWVLDGDKTWISNGGIADVYTVFARTGEAPGARGLSAFLVPAGVPGLKIAERIDTMAPHPLGTLSFRSCRLPGDALIGSSGQGFKIAMAVLDHFRPTVAAAALGLARRAFDEASRHVANRRVKGVPLSEFQLVQGHIAEMALEIDASALLTYRAAWAKDRGQSRITREAAMAKLYATEAAQRVIDTAVQLFGGEGVRSGTPVERLYREIRALRIYEGATDIQKIVISRHVLASLEEGK